MRRPFLILTLLLVGALVACSGSDDSGASEQRNATSEATSTPEHIATVEAKSGATEIAVPVPAEYVTLTVRHPVAVAGDSVVVDADRDPSNPLLLIGAAGVEAESRWTGAQAVLDLPGTLAAGVYVLQIEGQPSFATLRVVDRGGLFLATERSYVASLEGTTLRLSASMPVEGLIAWLVVETGEFGFGGVPLEQYYAPTASGYLAALPPKPLAEFLDRPLQLPAGVIGTMRIMAGTEETFLAEIGVDEYESNRVTVQNCDEGSMVTGTTAGPALVRVLWTDNGLRSAAIEADGDFWVEAGAGPVLVSVVAAASNDAATTPEYFAVDAPCEDSVSVGPVLAGPPSDVATDLRSTVSDSSGMGTTPRACRTVYVSPITIEGTSDDWGPYVAGELARALPNTSVISQWDADQVTKFEELRQLLDVGDDQLLVELGKRVGNADFVVTGTVKETLGEASVALFAFHRRPTDVDAQGTWSGGSVETALLDHALPELAEDLRDSAICGSVIPGEASIESDEEVPIIYGLLDLSGQRVDGATVSITDPRLGSLDPAGGPTDDGVFETTFTPDVGASGQQSLGFTSEWAGPSGTVRTREDEAWSRILIDADWRIHLEATQDYGDLGNDGYVRFTWDGEFTVDAEGVIEGSGTGELEVRGSCYIDGAYAEGPFLIPGQYTYNISGERTYAAAPDFVIGFTGTSFSVGEAVPAAQSGPCQLLVALGRGLGGELMRLIAHNPQLLPIESEGSLVLPAAAGTRSFDTWEGPPLTVTLEGVAYD